jgi:hypothetical protein
MQLCWLSLQAGSPAASAVEIRGAGQLSAPEVWLLIVNDQFLGPGELYVRPDHLEQWKFQFDFDKVLLFSREPGGTGEVIEIRRA